MECSMAVFVLGLEAEVSLDLFFVLARLLDLIKQHPFDIAGVLLEDCDVKQRESFRIDHLHQVGFAPAEGGVLSEEVAHSS